MSGNSFADFVNTVSKLGTVGAAAFWSEELQQRSCIGVGDTREAAIHRVSRSTGVPVNFLKRMRYAMDQISDVPSRYLIKLATAYYSTCEAIDAKTNEIRDERISLQRRRIHRYEAHRINREVSRGTRPALV